MKRILAAAAFGLLSTAAFAEQPVTLQGDYSAAVTDRYNQGPAEMNSAPDGIDFTATASIPDRDDNGMDERRLPGNYSGNVDYQDVYSGK